MTSISIPINGTDEFIEIPVDNLPDPEELISVLDAETAPVELWLEVAVQYYKKGQPDAFKKVLQRFEKYKDESIPAHLRDEIPSIVAVLNALAAYYGKQAHLQSTAAAKSDKEKRGVPDLMAKGTGLVNAATKLMRNKTSEINIAIQGVVYIYQDKIPTASRSFSTILDQNPDHIPALLGQAACLFREKMYADALARYQRVLQLNPNAEPSVRAGMANCYFHLGRPDLAKTALESILSFPCTDALRASTLIDLATLEKNEGDLVKATSLAKQAMRLNPNDPKALTFLAGVLINSPVADPAEREANLQKAYRFALKAYNTAIIPKNQAEAAYQLGRYYHALDEKNPSEKVNTQNVYKYYNMALQKWPENPLIQYGVAQSLIQQDQQDRAIKMLERIIREHPDARDAVRVLVALLMRKGTPEDRAKAQSLLKKEAKTDDFAALVETAELWQDTDTNAALKLYSAAEEVLKRRGETVPQEIYNNIAVANHLLKKYAEAESAYRLAITGDIAAAITNSGDSMDIDGGAETKWSFVDALESEAALKILTLPINVTVSFNVARLFEDTGNADAAIKLYLAILKEHPAYSDCYARLAYIAKERKMYSDAERWFKDIEAAQGESAYDEVQIALGSLYLQQGDKRSLEKAQACFTNVMGRDKRNVFASLHLANIYLSAARDAEDTDKRDKFLNHAMEFLYGALRIDSHNVFAANGLAIVFYERGMLTEAKDFFMQVREATGSIPDVFVNLAHCNVLEGQYEKAIKLYKTALNQFYGGKNPEILNNLAKCYYELGLMKECKEALTQQLELTPDDRDAQFNLALALKENATRLYQDPNVTSDKLLEAIQDYKAAVPIFQRLVELSTEKVRRQYSATKCHKLQRLCENNMELAEGRVAAVQEAERLKAEELRRKKEIAEEVEREKQRRMEEEAKAEALRKLELERIAKEQQQRLEELKQKMAKRQEEEAQQALLQAERKRREGSTSLVKKPREKKKKRRGKRSEEDEDEGSYKSREDSDEAEYDPNKPELAEGRGSDDEAAKESDHESDEREAREGDFSDESDRDDAEFKGDGKKKRKGKKKDKDENGQPTRRSGRDKKRKRSYKDESSQSELLDLEEPAENGGETKKKKRRILKKSDKAAGEEEGAGVRGEGGEGGEEGGDLLGDDEIVDMETLPDADSAPPPTLPVADSGEKGLLDDDDALFED